MSESGKPLGDKSVAQTHSQNAIDILIDEPGDTTDRPRRPNVPRDPPPPRWLEAESRDEKPQEPS